MLRRWIAIAALAVMGWPLAAPMAQANDQALPISADFSTLYQRVLTRPGARLLEAPGGAVTRPLVPFEVFYVYAREDGHVRVGSRVEDGFAGYIAAEQVLDWNTAIVATFNNRALNDRGRALIFDSEEALRTLITEEDVAATAEAYRAAAIAGDQAENSGVLSIEPEEHVDIRERMYILPILDHQRMRLPGRQRGEMLKIASITSKEPEPPADDTSDQVFEFVFVIDTTRSMRPYIDGTRRAITDMAQRIAGSDVGDRARFGLVTFRDNTELAPGVGYVTNTALALGADATVDRFLERIAGVSEATASTDGFNEDSLAGLHAAITRMDWSEGSGKFIFLVTDAGPRTENLWVQGLQLGEVRRLADEKNIAITAWHLTTAQGRFDHASAASAYRQISNMGNTDAYREIPGGDPAAFEAAVSRFMADMETVLANAGQGVLADDITDDIDPLIRELGMAMQLAYLGAQGGAVPDVFEGYILSKGIPQFGSNTLDVRVMLTRNQLATLTDTVRAIHDEMLAATLDPITLFEQLQNTLALLAQDGTRLAAGRFEVLGDGAQNFLQALPYQSPLMGLTQDDWVDMGASGQIRERSVLESKLRAYEEIYADPSLWTALSPDAPEGEHVSLILLDLMP